MAWRGGGGGSQGSYHPVRKDTVARIVKSFAPYRREIIWTCIAILASAGLAILPPFYLRTIINQGLMGRNIGVVTRSCLLSIGAILGGTALSIGYGYLSTVTGQRIMRDYRNQLYDHLQGMSLKFFTNTRTGEIQSRLVSDVGSVQSLLSDTAASILSNVTIVLSTLVGMFLMNWQLSLLSVGILPVFALLGARVGRALQSVRTGIQSGTAAMNSTMQETLSVSGVLLTKTSGRRALALKHFERENQSLTDSQVRFSMVMRMFFNLIQLTFQITPTLVYWFAGYLMMSGKSSELTIGTIVGFTALQSRLFFPLTTLLNSQVDVVSGLALFDRIFEYLDMPQDIVDRPGAASLEPSQVRGLVEFKDVCFRYDDSQDTLTLSHIDFEAKPGSLTAIVGHSGAGKTTLTYLIPRLYDVLSGEVRIDGHDVRDVTQNSLAGLIAVVTQETYLVHDTIRENLRYGKPDATDEELEAAAKAAAIHDHIASLPEGYSTIVGERGYKLSGGEKQRVAIARAILKNPKIMILDEATSALDTQSERLIQTALSDLMVGRTTFAIAHRLSTILAADQILVMEEGHLIERGRHQELLEKGGVYAALYAAQFEGEMTVEASP